MSRSGVKPEASSQELDAAYQRLSRAYLARDFRHFPHRYQLRFEMSALRKLLGESSIKSFGETYGVPRDRVFDLEHDIWDHISRELLQRLMGLAERVKAGGPDGRPFELIRLVPNPIWDTFTATTPAMGFIGRGLDERDVTEDRDLINTFEKSGIKVDLAAKDQDLREAMRTRDCIFVGSPKCNAWTLQAVEALFKGTHPDIRFHWPGWPSGRQATPCTEKAPARSSSKTIAASAAPSPTTRRTLLLVS